MLSLKDKVFASKAGLKASLVTDAGEVIAQIPVPQGETGAAYFLRFQRNGATVSFPDGVDVLTPPSALAIDFPEGHADTAAVPAVAPTVATAMEQMLLRRLRSTEMAQARALAEMKANIGHEAARLAAEEIKKAMAEAAAVKPAPVQPEATEVSPDAQQP